MSDTLTILPGEGETRTQVRVRRECDLCTEPATVRIAFLLPNCRYNAASSAYGRDDCSWCSDTERFSCAAHEREVARLDGYEVASKFRVSERFAHMFLQWRTAR